MSSKLRLSNFRLFGADVRACRVRAAIPEVGAGASLVGCKTQLLLHPARLFDSMTAAGHLFGLIGSFASLPGVVST